MNEDTSDEYWRIKNDEIQKQFLEWARYFPFAVSGASPDELHKAFRAGWIAKESALFRSDKERG